MYFELSVKVKASYTTLEFPWIMISAEYMWIIPKRSDSEWEAGIGKNYIISATKKYEKLIGKTCVYAVSYYKDTFHTKTKCQN